MKSSDENKVGFFKRTRARLCHHCPLCKHGRNKPASLVGKLLHHKLHSENCPMWKAEQELYKDADESS